MMANEEAAREASKKILEDLLMTAGANDHDDEDDSPSIVKMQSVMDDTF